MRELLLVHVFVGWHVRGCMHIHAFCRHRVSLLPALTDVLIICVTQDKAEVIKNIKTNYGVFKDLPAKEFTFGFKVRVGSEWGGQGG